MALRDYMRKTGFSRAIVAISGGIDSALALAIAVDALGADRVVRYNLPSRFNTETTKGIANRLASAFGVRYGVVPIQALDEHVREVFETHAHPIAQNLTKENLHARIRGLLMMAESNDTGALLISCGNETEIALGYATLYGDMCGAFRSSAICPRWTCIGWLATSTRGTAPRLIPEETFQITPRRSSRRTVDPFDYSVVSPVVGEIVEHQASPEDLVKLFERQALRPVSFRPGRSGCTIYDKYTIESFRALVHNAARSMRRAVYKRLQGPPIVVVSERAFGFNCRETIINKWDGG